MTVNYRPFREKPTISFLPAPCLPPVVEVRSGPMPKPKRAKRAGIPTVSDYMSTDVRSIGAGASLRDAGRLLQKFKVGSLLVDDSRRYVGIITERDLTRRAVAKGLDPLTTQVKACMSRPILSIEDTEPLSAAMELMRESGVRHLAVTEDETIIGILSVSDLLRYFSTNSR
jgi:CBS domain-containing protein